MLYNNVESLGLTVGHLSWSCGNSVGPEVSVKLVSGVVRLYSCMLKMYLKIKQNKTNEIPNLKTKHWHIYSCPPKVDETVI